MEGDGSRKPTPRPRKQRPWPMLPTPPRNNPHSDRFLSLTVWIIVMPLSCIILGTLFVSSPETTLFSAPAWLLHGRKQQFRSGNSRPQRKWEVEMELLFGSAPEYLLNTSWPLGLHRGDMLMGWIVSSQKDTLSPNSRYLWTDLTGNRVFVREDWRERMGERGRER